MYENRLNSWPIAVLRGAERTFVGITDRLGDGRTWRDLDAPSLEEVGGERWSEELLSALLPAERAWAWWTPRRVLRQLALPAIRTDREVSLDALDDTLGVRASLWWEGMALAVIPPSAGAQRAVRAWAAHDSELPEVIWSAPSETSRWDTDVIVTWCRSRERWSDPRSVEAQPAERILVLSDGCFFCALPPATSEPVLAALQALAARWALALVSARAEHAWLAPPR